MLELKGLHPRRRRSRLGPTRYLPRCKCSKPLPVRDGVQQHTGPCETCAEWTLAYLKMQSQFARE